MGTRLEEIRQLREYVGQKMREGAAEAPLREVLMREGGWSTDDLDMIFAQVKATATQSPLEPTKPESPSPENLRVPVTTTVTTTTTTAPPATLSFEAPQSSPEQQTRMLTSTPESPVPLTTPISATSESVMSPNTASEPATASPVQGASQSQVSLLFARLPYLRRMLYVLAVVLALLAGFIGYRIAIRFQPVDPGGSMRETPGINGGGGSSPQVETEDTGMPSFPEVPQQQEEPVIEEEQNNRADPIYGEVSVSDPTMSGSGGTELEVHAVTIGSADATRTLASGDKVLVSWEQSGVRDEYTSFTLKDVTSDAEYGNAGGGYFASGEVEASAYIPFGAPNGTYHIRVYVRPATCFPVEFKNLIQGYQPLLASTETNWCGEESYTMSDSSNTVTLSSQQ